MNAASLWPDAVSVPDSAQNLGARLSRVLTAAEDATLDVAASTCIEDLCHYVGCNRGFVAIFDEHERLAREWQWEGSGRPFTFPPTGSNLEQILGSLAGFLRIGRTLAIGDMDGLELGPTEAAFVEENGGLPKAAMMLPILVADNLVGIVGIQSMDETKVWTRSVIAEMEAFAELLVRLLGRTTERRALAEANARARRIAAHLPDGLVMLTTEGDITWVSPSFEAMSSFTAAELDRRPFVDLVSPTDRPRLFEQLALVTAGPDASIAVRISDPGGDWRWADLSLSLAAEPHSGVPDEIVVTVRDTHERHLREMQLVAESDRDPLTGLANRSAFERFVSELCAGDAPVMVAFCDVDDFKAFNDRLGHDAGDDILRSVAGAIGRAVRSRDMVARIGGDEFVVIVVDPGHDAARLGERLVAAVRAVAAEGKGEPTVSVGVCGPGPALGAREMVRMADEAMYSAKRAGKDRWVRATPESGFARSD
ncbi:MAG: sensor domain-containing diguanylate cyclase [Acidimicrobiales bacterium]